MKNKVKFKKLVFKRGRPKKKISPRKKLRKELDDSWREIIKLRAGGRCECVTDGKRCEKRGVFGRGTNLNSHHIFGKSNFRVRWDLRNGIALCPGHHTLNNDSAHNASPWFDKMLKKLRGKQKYLNLMHEAMKDGMAIHHTMEDLEKIKEELTKTLKEIKDRG